MPEDWNAAVYQQVSEPQLEWGRTVLSRLRLAGDEHALDVGCGTGRVTLELAGRLPRGRVTATDRSASMLQRASLVLGPRGIAAVQADATQLPFAESFDVVFSTATFHWVTDHDALFASLYRALRLGGRLHAQCGGGPNLARLLYRANLLMRTAPFAPLFGSWREPWLFAGPADTATRLRRAGFAAIEAALESTPVHFAGADAFRRFIEHVCIRPHLERLPDSLKASFTDQLVGQAACDLPPFVLDYCRLNLAATRLS